ncbi:unnamed protein product [Didymodactylos carnosus]|uniref:Uncharacterized protein n=1 Tax=Didymodactylos carnosus TaxID=1234261 RepID=A0A8S2UT59_9BILA|nr:unnamed protein product [Didymodactylos carnosus]CAF4335442.1 unnamed protein product [Didymodactylos carnosus]
MKSLIQEHLNYLLDSEITTDLVFQQFIDLNNEQNEIFHVKYINIFEEVINEKLKELTEHEISITNNNTNYKHITNLTEDVESIINDKKNRSHTKTDQNERQIDSEEVLSSSTNYNYDEDFNLNDEKLNQRSTTSTILTTIENDTVRKSFSEIIEKADEQCWIRAC